MHAGNKPRGMGILSQPINNGLTLLKYVCFNCWHGGLVGRTHGMKYCPFDSLATTRKCSSIAKKSSTVNVSEKRTTGSLEPSAICNALGRPLNNSLSNLPCI